MRSAALLVTLLAAAGPLTLPSRAGAAGAAAADGAGTAATATTGPEPAALAGPHLSRAEARRFLRRLLRSERRFYRPGIAWDEVSGLTFDGHPIDVDSGEPVGGPRNWSAASKESLHIIMLVAAVSGDPIATALLAPEEPRERRGAGRLGARRRAAAALALNVLERKIGAYERFAREYPGFGGFLPWFSVERARIVPSGAYWADKVPGLDNGQLAWSLYLAAHGLADTGHAELAARFRRHFDLMRRNVVRVFYDAERRQLRAEARVSAPQAPPEQNEYASQNRFALDDAYEGLLLVHFADLFGDWRGRELGREWLWRTPRREPIQFAAGAGGITVVRGNWFSSHEEWGFLVLPFRDHPMASRLFANQQRVRTLFAASHRHSGLFASTHEPVRQNRIELRYLSAAGIQEVAREKVQEGGEPVFAPYAAFPLALIDERLFATWLSSMLAPRGRPRTGVLGPLGTGESYTESGGRAPLVTWDGKALLAVALMGGIAAPIRGYLQRDGKYSAFLRRVREDYRLFDAVALAGEELPYYCPGSRPHLERAQP